jgi:aminoglycoside phosphotransferase family enzyme/predicted kinase
VNAGDQSATLALLADPATYGPGIGPVRRIDTHISALFLAGDRAYKLKRAVAFPYLDFSTVARRHAACLAELSVNRRTAPDLYLDVRPVCRGPGDDLTLGGDPDRAVDWVVVMRRFPDDGLWDSRAAAGNISADDVRDLADAVAAFHDAAEITPAHGGTADLLWTAAGNAVDLAKLFPGDAARELDRATRSAVARHDSLIAARAAAGAVRRCHGDLHLRNIATVDGKPLPFDAIEFDDRIACIDTLYDLAFLIVDWLRVGRRDFASATLSRHLARRPDEAGLALLPLFLSLRAGIKAKTRAAAGATDEARACFEMACALIAPPPPRLVAVGGLSGSGKSVLAAALAETIGPAPGALVLRSDVERKRLAGVDPEAKLPRAAYTPEASTRVYASLHARARTALAAGHSVVLDAVHADRTEREAAADLAAGLGVPFAGLWLDCPLETRLARVVARTGDASDADAQIVRRQTEACAPVADWHIVNADRMPSDTLDAARAWLAAR